MEKFAMGVIIGGSYRKYQRRLQNPESLTYEEIKRLCDFFKIDIVKTNIKWFA